MFEKFTEKAIKVILLAQEEVRRLGHNFVGVEFIFLGLIAEETGIAAQILRKHGIQLESVRIEVEKIVGEGSDNVSREIPFTQSAKMVLNNALSFSETKSRENR